MISNRILYFISTNQYVQCVGVALDILSLTNCAAGQNCDQNLAGATPCSETAVSTCPRPQIQVATSKFSTTIS